jgi:hypothetical protein
MKCFFLILASSFLLGGCIYRHEEVGDDDGYGGHSGYGSSRSCTGGSTASGGTSGTSPGTGGIVEPPPPPECMELATEAACSERADCTPIYAGTDCSCGPECTCIGGEPGCVCESFGFLVCVEAEAAE